MTPLAVLEDVGGSAFHGEISAVRMTRKTAQVQRDRAPPGTLDGRTTDAAWGPNNAVVCRTRMS